jgi:hypothetical protein
MKSIQFKLTGIPFMLASDKARTMVYLSTDTDTNLRVLAARHRKGISELAEAMILHCLGDRKFLNSLKKEEAIDY